MGGTERQSETFALYVVLGVGIVFGLFLGLCFGLVIK